MFRVTVCENNINIVEINMDDKKIAASDVDGGADSLEIETLSHDEAKRLQETVRTAYRPAFEALKDK